MFEHDAGDQWRHGHGGHHAGGPPADVRAAPPHVRHRLADQDEARLVDLLAPVDVGEHSCSEDQRGDRQDEGVLHPRQLRGRASDTYGAAEPPQRL
ncbi:hypothetical protein ACFFR3_29835 [Nonomuraea salmonea]|uniref:Uncharacterized protein n=1 Tax=Nonomuraea salmonea TaxID=46181 RepID=A0ABV5NTU5_9ACTN